MGAGDIDIHGYEKRLSIYINAVNKSDLSDTTKEILFDYLDHLKYERTFRGKTLTIARVTKNFNSAFLIARRMGGLDKPNINDIKIFSRGIRDDKNLSEWTKADYRTQARLLIKWLYKTGRIDKVLQDYVKENLKTGRPATLKKASEILTIDEVDYLIRAALTRRDKAFIAVLADGGFRIGELGSVRIKDISYQQNLIQVSFKGKTGIGDTLLFDSVPYLKDWLEEHPMAKNPEAPLWPNNYNWGNGKVSRGAPMNYSALKGIIKRAINRHNQTAKGSDGKIPEIKKRIHPHLFRYYATIRDINEGLPQPTIEAQRNWRPGSRQLSHYSRLASEDKINHVLKAKGVPTKNKNGRPKSRLCPNCEEVFPGDRRFCSKCGTPLDRESFHWVESQKKLDNETDESYITQLEERQRILEEKLRVMEKKIQQLG